jgi:hypothetical protein
MDRLPSRPHTDLHARRPLPEFYEPARAVVHSFTPVLGGEIRKADIGLLFDSRRPAERAFCLRRRREVVNALAGSMKSLF